MIRKFCDRCGEEGDIQLTSIRPSYRFIPNGFSSLNLDLCNKCELELMDFLLKFPTENMKITSDLAKVA